MNQIIFQATFELYFLKIVHISLEALRCGIVAALMLAATVEVPRLVRRPLAATSVATIDY